MTTRIRITSYGTGHNDPPPPAANPVVDTTALRNPPDDPAARRQRHLERAETKIREALANAK